MLDVDVSNRPLCAFRYAGDGDLLVVDEVGRVSVAIGGLVVLVGSPAAEFGEVRETLMRGALVCEVLVTGASMSVMVVIGALMSAE